MAIKKSTQSSETITEADSITPKSTKEQILNAYQDAVKRLEEIHKTPQEEKKNEDAISLVKKASNNSIEGIISGLANIKLTLSKQIDSLGEGLATEFRKFTELQHAIDIESKHLEDIYNIKVAAHTLSGLILAQQEQKQKFEAEIEEQKRDFEITKNEKEQDWNKKQTILELEYEERQREFERRHKREEEDYTYALEIERRKNKDEYENKRQELEKELALKQQELLEKEKQFKDREEDFDKLKQQVENFPIELEKAQAESTQMITEKLEQTYKFESQLKEQEVQGTIKLQNQRIQSLEAKIKEQEGFIKQLTEKADAAIGQVQLIACRALNASAQRIIVPSYTDEKSQEKHKIS